MKRLQEIQDDRALIFMHVITRRLLVFFPQIRFSVSATFSRNVECCRKSQNILFSIFLL